MARILLAASDPAIELLLERFGHEVPFWPDALTPAWRPINKDASSL
jgi:hypothetical protein